MSCMCVEAVREPPLHLHLNILQTVVLSFHHSTQLLRALPSDLAIGAGKGIMVKPHG